MEGAIGQISRSWDSNVLLYTPCSSSAGSQPEDGNGILQWVKGPAISTPDISERDAASPDLYSPIGDQHSAVYNGQVLLTVTSNSCWLPQFDLELCREQLAQNGIQIPAVNLNPLRSFLEHPQVKRYLLFTSGYFQLFLAPVLYSVIWCGLYSTVHMYLNNIYGSFFWLFSLALSIISLILTTIVLLILNMHSRQININTDVRLIYANEILCSHKVLAGISNTIYRCSSIHQIFFVYFDLVDCHRRLTSLLDEMSLHGSRLQSKLQKNLSHLNLVTKVSTNESKRSETEESEDTPLLFSDGNEAGTSSTTVQNTKKKVPQFTVVKSIVPTGSAEEIAHQLLVTFSAVYVKLLVTLRLPVPQHTLHTQRAGTACICQYIESCVLR
ncbi:transmembrane protein 268 isoform X1 [Erpetoichthys calabaricus]|uniref:Transmembrane protein 268 n=1 Tax=Erpetoichthys calabaricus TaxID=27687 RepID=A0A8C4RS10_ERPCA|nr:transmembrane protein 268 isoform X1 [Erpetoichthys calabaricus]XP_028656914.1 transmembrane protein 268 isoform X1 [Erpetoichthys calabaricus]